MGWNHGEYDEINGYRAVVQYDPDIDVPLGEFVASMVVDFYAKDIDGLRRKVNLAEGFPRHVPGRWCGTTEGVFGKFNLRVSPQLHAEIATRATAAGKSLNQWVADVLSESLSLSASSF